MRSLQELAGIVLLAGMASSCAGIDYDWSYDSEAEFGALTTYEWGPIRAASSKFVKARTLEQIDWRLQEAGYRQVPENADFRVVVDFDSESRSVVNQEGYDPTTSVDDVPSSWVMGGFGTPNVHSYRGASMQIEVQNARTGEPMWRGHADGMFSFRVTDDERAAVIEQVVGKLLGNFPPRH